MFLVLLLQATSGKKRPLMKKIDFIVCLFLIFIQGHAPFMACTQEEAFAAEATVSDISTWKELYESYILYIHCDDGAIAAGYSD
jgi:regulation of enolase protein 1 (concanavalin A-like superfamily)